MEIEIISQFVHGTGDYRGIAKQYRARNKLKQSQLTTNHFQTLQ